MSAVVISAVLLSITFAAGTAGFFARFDALGAQEAKQSRALADSCAEVALLRLARSSGSAGLEPTELEAGIDAQGRPLRCVIERARREGAAATVAARGSYAETFVAVSVRAAIDESAGRPVRIESWSEAAP